MFGIAFRDAGVALSDLLALVRAADDAGYSSVWTPEVGSRDALVLASLYGQATHHTRIGTGVLPMMARTIPGLALGAAAAADACDGRFILGLGTGHPFTAKIWYGADWSKPRTRLEETVDVTRRILSGERVSHEGTFSITNFHLGLTPPPVPIYVAALTEASLRRAGRFADGVLLNWLPVDGVRTCAEIVKEAAAEAGRDVQVLSYVRVAVVDDGTHSHSALEALREQTYSYLSLPNYANSVKGAGLAKEIDDMAAGKDRAVDKLVDAVCAWGDNAAVKERLHEYEHAGLDEVIAYPVPYGDEPIESVLHTIRALSS